MPTDDDPFDEDEADLDRDSREVSSEPDTDENDDSDDGVDGASHTPSYLRRRVVVALALTVIAAVAGWYLVIRDEGLSGDAVLAVDGEELTEEEFSRRLDLLTALYGVERPDPASEEFDRFRRDSAKSVAVGMVLEAAAAERGVDLAERAVADAFARYIEQQYPVGGRDAFIQQLGNVGVSEAEVLAEFRRTLITRLLYNDVVEEVTVSDEELAAEYDARREELAIDETRSLRHLVVSTEEAAVAAKSRIDAGEEFSAVASEISLDAATAAEGGSLGIMSADMLDPAFAEPAFSADVGVAFGPVRTDLGWYLGVVDEVFPPRTPTLDEIRDQLRTRIRIERELEQWRQFLERTIADADIDYADDYRPENPDAPPPVVLPDPLSVTTTAPGGTPPSTTRDAGEDEGG